MADPEIPDLRAEMQREEARKHHAEYSDARVRSAVLFMLAVALLMAVAVVLLR